MAITRNEIKEKLAGVIHMAMPNLELTAENFDDSMNFMTDLGLTSVGILYIVIAIEETFSIRFEDVGFADFQTVGDVVDYVEKKIQQ